MTGVALTLLASPLAAQTIRDYEYSRPLRGEEQLRAIVEFGAGRLALRAGAGDHLYSLILRYDADRFRPIGSYNAAGAEVRLGVEGTGSGGIRVDSRRALPQTAVVELPTSVALSLDIRLGATESTLELGGLRISEFDLKTGASRTSVTFGSKNRESCRTASVTSGAGEITVMNAGNSGCRSWRFDGGVGAVTIDLGGAWPADARLSLNMALGGVTLQTPRDLGLKVRVGGFLAGFESSGFSKENGVYTSANYAAAARHIEVTVTSALGGVKVEWK
ncbi:MAG: hypothetical protein HOP28_01765 [Gemmatimonadales bacterium]|nr:hypothetical protein [Gemmatimonadales bacterium]